MRRSLFLLLVLFWAVRSDAAIAVVTSGGAKSTNQNAITTAALDTTGATLLVCSCQWYSGGTDPSVCSDSKTNTWTHLVDFAIGQHSSRTRLSYVNSATPTVGSGHTFTCSGTGNYPQVTVLALSGTAASPLDQSTGTFDATVDTSSGSAGTPLTPAEANCIVISAIGLLDASAGPTIDGGFTLAYTGVRTANSTGGGLAYLIQTTATAANPTWTWTTGSAAGVSLASFKSSGGAPAVTPRGLLIGILP